MLAASLFLLCALFIAYALIGFPLLLWWASLWKSRPVQKHWSARTVSILLPVHNGEKWIQGKLESLLKLNYPRELLQIIVISNGSTDRTGEIAAQFASSGVELIHMPRRGKASALNAGMKKATGEILFFTDVRQPLDPDSLRNLIECFADPSVGVASGELVILKGDRQQQADIGLYWRYEKWIRKRLSAIDSVVGASGCIYAMRRELAQPLPPDSLVDDVHLPLAAFFRGYRVILEESAKAFDYPIDLSAEFRRKVRTLAGNYQVMRYYPGLLGPANRMWIYFMSHKFARLLLPHTMLLLFISSFFLPPPWAGIAIMSQLCFYALAAVDPLVPELSPFKRLTSPVRTFVVLLAAAFCAASFFFSGAKGLWKETKVEA